MKVIFDHNVPHKLRRLLPGLYVQNADEMGWGGLANGLLLQKAEDAGFDVMVTCDQNIFYQQNLLHKALALVVLTTNDWHRIKLQTEKIFLAVQNSRPGSFLVVEIPS